jgi:hypothetical protein
VRGGGGSSDGTFGLALLPGVQFDFVFSSVLLMTVGGASIDAFALNALL